MTYFEGNELGTAMTDSNISKERKLSYFNQLDNIILNLPFDVQVGDLHANNIIAKGNHEVVLIDLDGFIIKADWQISCPLSNIDDLPLKYYK